MLNTKNNNEEVITMEKTTFIQRHAKKILLAGGVVVAAGTYYILKKHGVELGKLREENELLKIDIEQSGIEIQNLIEDNDVKDKEIGFIKFLVVESDCVPKALQNAENKLARKESKIQALCEALQSRPYDKTIIDAIEKHEAEAGVLREQITKTLKLNELIVNDENIYAK